MRNPLRTLPSLIDWLRAGYPDEAPRTGYSPLIALNGPIALSQKQTQEVVDELGADPSDRTEVGVAITKATGRLPNASQVRGSSKPSVPRRTVANRGRVASGMRDDHVVGVLGDSWVERGDQRQPDQRSDDLGGDESENRAWIDAGESVGEHAADRDGRVGDYLDKSQG